MNLFHIRLSLVTCVTSCLYALNTLVPLSLAMLIHVLVTLALSLSPVGWLRRCYYSYAPFAVNHWRGQRACSPHALVVAHEQGRRGYDPCTLTISHKQRMKVTSPDVETPKGITSNRPLFETKGVEAQLGAHLCLQLSTLLSSLIEGNEK